ncbi:MAG TPA: MerR family transcriptional regulator [Dissulfurispiraceae bacterium]|nr:MerR family transcriptional regulator [Dissulfurispiraceae bacterium]
MQRARSSSEPLRLFPEKLFYKIGEVSALVGVETYVLRYWQNEFPSLRPRKSRSGQRIYTKKDIDLILLIRRLLHEERYTIDGVRRKLGGMLHDEALVPVILSEPPSAELQTACGPQDAERIIRTIRERLTRILENLS